MVWKKSVTAIHLFLAILTISTASHAADNKRKSPARGFAGIASAPLQIEPHGPYRCDLYFFRAQSTDSAFDGLSGEFRNAIGPSDAELDAVLSRYSDCGYRFVNYSMYKGPILRIFPGRRPYFLDPFGEGEAQAELANQPDDFGNITSADALTEHTIWQYISAASIYVSVDDYHRRLAKEGVRYANIKANQKLALPSFIKTPSEAELAQAEKVARGAVVRVFRALRWQYEQMKNAPTFPIAECAAYGPIRNAIYNVISDSKFPSDLKTRQYNALEEVDAYRLGFESRALSTALASFSQVPSTGDNWDGLANNLRQKVYREASNYACLRDGPQFVQNIANDRFKQISDAWVVADRQAFEAETKKRAESAKAALIRNARAASGDFAPVADDLVRAIINARRQANATGMAVGSAIVGKDKIFDSFDYESGLYVEDYAVQRNTIQHFVNSPSCTRVTKVPVVYDCTYNIRFNISVSVFGMALPEFKTPFVQHSNRFEFRNGQWGSESLVKAYETQRKAAAATANSYDPSKGIREFHCINTRAFADRFGLVSDC